MRRLGWCLVLSLPLWIFEPASSLTFRAIQWGALFVVAGALLVRRPRRWATETWLFAGCVPPAASFALYRNGESLIALGAWASFAVLLQLRRKGGDELLRTVQSAFLAGVAANLGLLLLQVLGLDPLFAVPEQVRVARLMKTGTAGFTGFVGNAADLAILLVLSLPIADAYFAARPRLRWTALALLITGVAVTGSRVPLVLGVGYLTWRLPGRWRWVAPALLAVAVLAYSPLRNKTLGAVEHGLFAEQVARRTTEWRVAAGVWAQKPLVPQGFGRYGALEAEYRFEHALPVRAYHGWFAQAHNDFLQTAVEAGLWGLLAFALALMAPAKGLALREVAPWSFALFVPLMLVHFPVRLAPAVFALALGAQLPPGPLHRSRFSKAGVVVLFTGLMLGAGVVACDWAAANHIFSPGQTLRRLLPEARTRLMLEEAQSDVAAGRTAEAEAAWQQILDQQPHPHAASSLAASLLARGEVRGALTTACRVYVVTGYPPLGAWLGEHRAHVANLAQLDRRLAVCVGR